MKAQSEELLGLFDFVKSNDAIVRLVVMTAVMCRARQLLVPRQVGHEAHGRSWCEETFQVSCFSEQRVRKKKKTWAVVRGVLGREKSSLYSIRSTGGYQDARDQPS